MDKLDKLLANAFSIERPIAFFPVRHHSPACSYHVRRAIDMYKPDCILIEAPSDTDTIIPYLGDSEPPIAIYYSYQSGEKRNACYYPLQSFSPEFVAVKAALAAGIPVHFIDLPLGNISMEEEKLELKEASEDKKTWYNDYFLQRSKYIQTLCEKENCRGHGELWEKLFEISAASVSTEMFIKNLLTFCYFARVDYPEQLLTEENDSIREMYMAENIIKHQKKYKRILAVTGGFHTAALMELIETKKVKKIKPLSGKAYLIPYSYEESDQLTGYASGMPYPGYYQAVYDNLEKSESNFFHKTTLIYITKLAKILRKNRENISLSEESAAFAMGLGLADMRDKEQPGVYELIDGVQSAFVKGELNMSTSFVMEAAARLLRGEKIGKVGKDAPVPPIVLDFTNIATSYKMNITSTIPKTITLDIVSKARHQEQSVFLHRLGFLNNPYAKKTFGPDYKKRINTKLVREKWDYVFTANVVSALIEKSHYGGTIVEACEAILSENMKNECHSSSDAANLLIQAAVMAMFNHTERLINLVRNKIEVTNSYDISVES